MQELIREQQTQQGGAPPSAGSLEALLHGDERPARSELRRQIARLDLELSELFTSAFPKGGISFEVAPTGGPRLLSIGELEQVRDRLLSRIADVRGILSDHGYVEERNREFLEQVIAEPQRYHWVRISNEDIGMPGCRHFHSKPRWGLIGMLMGWWRVKVSSGCPLAERLRPLQTVAFGRPRSTGSLTHVLSALASPPSERRRRGASALARDPPNCLVFAAVRDE